MATKIYKEKQEFDNIHLLVIIVLLGLFLASWSIYQILAIQGLMWSTATSLLLTLAIVGGTVAYLKQLRLKLEITDKKIKYKLYPLHKQKQHILWDEVKECKIVKTPELAQWNGGNITRYHERRFSLNGRNGLSITTKDGKRYLIGSQNLERLEKAMLKHF